jgi:cytochrome c551
MNFRSLSFLLISCSVLASCADNQEKAPTQTGDQRDLYNGDKGKALFETKCAMCHGNDGTASIGNAANLQISRLDVPSIKEMMQTGKNGMPTFKGQLSDEEMSKVAAYVQTLRK